MIIPTLNEAGYIDATLTAIENQSPRAVTRAVAGEVVRAGALAESPDEVVKEVIIVDGGSTDATKEIVTGRARFLTAAPGRAVQMNAGARAATGQVLLFLHADTLLPPEALELVVDAIARGCAAGIFRLAFDEPASLLLRFSALMTRINSRTLCFGDRALFVTKEAYFGVGGFPDIPVFEDLELASRLHDRAAFAFLSVPVTTSARRFRAAGDYRRQWMNTTLWIRYLLGGDFRELARDYSYR